MSVDGGRTLTLTRTVAAPPEAVFDAWTRPEIMRRWYCPDPGADVRAETDLRVGGAYTIRMESDGGSHTVVGRYREIDRPRRLSYTWDWEEEGQRMGVDTVVTVEFTAVDDGTRVRLTHQGFPSTGDARGHDEGWALCLDRLGSARG